MKINILLPFLFWPAVLLSCSKKSETATTPPTPETPKEVLATVTTLKTSNITSVTATVGGRLVKGSGSSVTAKGVCWSKSTGPNISGSKVLAVTEYGSGEFYCNLTGLEFNTIYYVRAFVTNSTGTAYGAEDTFATSNALIPTILTNNEYNNAAKMIFAGGEVKDDGNNEVIRRGLCWSTGPTPTIANDTTIDGKGEGSFRSTMKNLSPNTLYYVRAYATNGKGTAYGEVVQMTTNPLGNVTYTLIKSTNPTADEDAAYKRITEAMDAALYYYNNFTTITKKLTVSYNTGVATADGNFNGSIRFGSNPAYSKTGTAMHEIAHTVGVGQHSFWNTLIQNGVYQGTYARQVLRNLSGDPAAVLKGDSQHFWPYGINGYWEDTGDPNLYMIQAMIVAGMKKDGLPSN